MTLFFKKLFYVWVALSLVFSSFYPLVGFSYALEPASIINPSIHTSAIINNQNNNDLTLKDETLGKTFNYLSEGFSAINLGLTSDKDALKSKKINQQINIDQGNTGGTKYSLDSGVTVETKYKTKNNISPVTGNKPIKQDIIVTNPFDHDINVNLNVNHSIDVNKDSPVIFWDGKEYKLTDQPQTFKAYKGTARIDPKDKAYDETLKDFPGRENLPNIIAPSYRGSSISFKTKAGNTAIYDFTDVASLDHQVTLQKQNNQIILTLTLNNIHVDKNSQTTIDPNYDLATAGNYNLRYDGAAANDGLGITVNPGVINSSIAVADLDNDGKPDILVGADETDNNSRSNSGSLYVIYNTLLSTYTSTGNNIDLSTSTNYNLRFDGAVAGDKLAMSKAVTGDLNGDGKQDLLIPARLADNNSRTDSGSLYVIYNNLITSYSGTGNNIDLATSTNYSLRFDGAVASDSFGYAGATVADLNGDGLSDLLISAFAAGNNSRATSGSLYVLYNSAFSTYTSTGNNIDMATATNYNLRFDGAVASDNFSYGGALIADINSDGNKDIVVGAWNAANNSRANSGSLYVIYNGVFSTYTSTGNNIDLATSTNYNLRYDGSVANELLTDNQSFTTADLDGDGKQDILIGGYGASNNSRSGSGSLYVIYNTLIDDYSNTGNNIDMATATNYNLRFDGVAASDRLGNAVLTADFDGDGKQDILVGSYLTDYNSRSNSGSLFVIYNTLFSTYTGTGNNIDMATSTNYNLRFDGAGTTDAIAFRQGILVSDLNSDGKPDILVGALADNNSRSNSGSLYVIYNFPQSFTMTSVSSPRNTALTSISGTLSAANATTTISGISYSTDNTSYSGTWTACTASDGSYNSTSESFSCTISSTFTDGSHSIYLRANDTNTSYTSSSNYGSVSFTMDTTNPPGSWTGSSGDNVTFSSNSPANNSYTDDELPTFTFTKSKDPTSGIAKYRVILTNDKQGLDYWDNRIYIDNIDPNPANGVDGSGKALSGSDSDRTREDANKVFYYKDYQVTVRSKRSADKLTPGSYKWKIKALDLAGNSIDTEERILKVKTRNSFFTQKDNSFPLAILTLGNLTNLNLASFNQSKIKDSYTINTANPSVYGITNSDATVSLSLENPQTKKVILSKSTTSKNSRFNLNITSADNLKAGEYILRLSAQKDDSYMELPTFKLVIQKGESFSQVKRVSAAKTNDQPAAIPTTNPTPVSGITNPPAPTKTLNNIFGFLRHLIPF